jgi:hypothetical protein
VETTTFHISKHYKLVDFTAIHHHQVFQAQLSDLIPVFEIADSSTRGSSQIFKGFQTFGNFDILTLGGKDLSPCCFCERDTERRRTRDWVLGALFCVKETD